jgi:ubiquinone/menaquinone biosynthesis C-methylase UbiE
MHEPDDPLPLFARTNIMWALVRRGGSLRIGPLLKASGLSVDELCAVLNELTERRWLRIAWRRTPLSGGPERLRHVDRITATRFGRARMIPLERRKKAKRRRRRRSRIGSVSRHERGPRSPREGLPGVVWTKHGSAPDRSSAMAMTDKLFVGSIPKIYDRFLVPLIFESYARDLAERLAEVEPQDVLETAAGTGVLTRAMASRLPAHVRIVATDLNQPMLDHAAARHSGDNRIAWQQADALALPFADRRFDAVACQFGVMFFPDKVQGYREARRVLKPGGHFFFNVWDRIAENEFADVVTEALAALFPQDPPRFMARTPHGYHDVARIREELTAAGFGSISIDTLEGVSRAASAREPAVAYCQGTPLRNEIEARDRSRLEEATHRAAEALAQRFGSGPVEGRIKAHVIAAIR